VGQGAELLLSVTGTCLSLHNQPPTHTTTTTGSGQSGPGASFWRSTHLL
jgi:hypothetical protein